MSSFTNRMVRAAKLDVNLYEEVEADKQAMGVVVLASLAAGIGSVGTTGISGVLLGTIGALIPEYSYTSESAQRHPSSHN